MSRPARFFANVHLLFERDDELLLLLRQNTGYADGQYALVAGYVDEGVSTLQAACQEALEEAGVTLDPADLDLCHVLHHRDGQGEDRYGLFFRPRGWVGEPANAEPQFCAELAWFPRGALPENVIPYVRRVLDLIGKGVNYSEWDA